jgi:hypothetical protein
MVPSIASDGSERHRTPVRMHCSSSRIYTISVDRTFLRPSFGVSCAAPLAGLPPRQLSPCLGVGSPIKTSPSDPGVAGDGKSDRLGSLSCGTFCLSPWKESNSPRCAAIHADSREIVALPTLYLSASPLSVATELLLGPVTLCF